MAGPASSPAAPEQALYYLTAAFVKNVFRRAWRSRVWLIIVVYFVVVLAITQLAPTPITGPGDKVRFALSVCVRTMAVFAILLSVFLAGTHLPRDIESKTIFTVLTKPVGRVKLLAGRLVGFWATVVVMLALMALGGWAVLWLNQWQATRAGGKSLVLRTKRPAYADRWQVVREKKPVHIKPTGEGLVWVTGDVDLEARFLFPDVKPAKLAVDNKISGECLFREISAGLGSETMRAQLIVGRLIEGQGQPDPQEEIVGRREIRLEKTTHTEFSFPADRIETGDTVYVAVTRRPLLPEGVSERVARVARSSREGTAFAVRSRKDLYLVKPDHPFEWNYVKAVLAVAFGCVLMCSVATMGSTFLSAPVSIIFGFFIYFCGSLVDLIRDIAATLGKPTTSILMFEYAPGTTVEQGPMVKAVNSIVRNVLTGLATVLPDFRKFGTTDYLLESFSIPMGTLAWAFLHMLIYAALSFAVASMFMWKREAEKS